MFIRLGKTGPKFVAYLLKCLNFNKPCNFKDTFYLFNKRCPHKGVLFDEMNTNCGILNSVSIYLT